MGATASLNYELTLADRFSGPLSRAAQGLSGFKSGLLAGAGAVLGTVTAGLGVLGVVGKAIKNAADLESTTVAFSTLTGSVLKAEAAMSTLKSLAASTPFEFPELAQAGRMLLAFGSPLADLPQTLTMVGDVASATGSGLTELAEIYGKARTAGTLFSEDINQLTGRGIPIIAALAKQMGVAESEVKNLAASGQITFPRLEQAFRALTSAGGAFHGMMQAQSATTLGKWSTLQDAVNSVLTSIGTPINDGLRVVMDAATERVDQLGRAVAEISSTARGIVADGQVGRVLTLAFGSAWESFRTYAGEAWEYLRTLAGALGGWISAAFSAERMSSFGLMLKDQMGDALDEFSIRLGLAASEFGTYIKQAFLDAMPTLAASAGITQRQIYGENIANATAAVAAADALPRQRTYPGLALPTLEMPQFEPNEAKANDMRYHLKELWEHYTEQARGARAETERAATEISTEKTLTENAAIRAKDKNPQLALKSPASNPSPSAQLSNSQSQTSDPTEPALSAQSQSRADRRARHAARSHTARHIGGHQAPERVVHRAPGLEGFKGPWKGLDEGRKGPWKGLDEGRKGPWQGLDEHKSFQRARGSEKPRISGGDINAGIKQLNNMEKYLGEISSKLAVA
jgi:tape measure domain-containing protein